MELTFFSIDVVSLGCVMSHRHTLSAIACTATDALVFRIFVSSSNKACIALYRVLPMITAWRGASRVCAKNPDSPSFSVASAHVALKEL